MLSLQYPFSITNPDEELNKLMKQLITDDDEPRTGRTCTTTDSSKESFTSDITDSSNSLSDSDYGFYDDNDLDNCYSENSNRSVSSLESSLSKLSKRNLDRINAINKTITTSNSSNSYQNYTSNSSSNSGLTSLTNNSSVSTNNFKILCLIENSRAPIVCRSFEDINSFGTASVTSLSIAGFRIIQTQSSEEAEYKFKFNVNNKELIVWRKFTHFRSLASACTDYSKRMRKRLQVLNNHSNHNSYNSYSYHSSSYDNNSLNVNSVPLKNTIDAWNDVMRSRPWFRNDLSINYLIAESSLLENFMKNLLFEIPDIEMILEFISDDELSY